MISLIAAALLAGTAPQGAAASPPALPAAIPSPERRQELLFEAARLGRTDLIAPLITAGADANARDRRGFTPVILTAYAGHRDTLDALLAAGADACLADAGQGNTALMGVAFKGEDAIAERLLAAGCDVNARNKAGQTALMMAALFNRTRQIELLLAAGADAALADASGRTAAEVARAQGNEIVAKKLASAAGREAAPKRP